MNDCCTASHMVIYGGVCVIDDRARHPEQSHRVNSSLSFLHQDGPHSLGKREQAHMHEQGRPPLLLQSGALCIPRDDSY